VLGDEFPGKSVVVGVEFRHEKCCEVQHLPLRSPTPGTSWERQAEACYGRV
jgi:hypothetical protein